MPDSLMDLNWDGSFLWEKSPLDLRFHLSCLFVVVFYHTGAEGMQSYAIYLEMEQRQTNVIWRVLSRQRVDLYQPFLKSLSFVPSSVGLGCRTAIPVFM